VFIDFRKKIINLLLELVRFDDLVDKILRAYKPKILKVRINLILFLIKILSNKQKPIIGFDFDCLRSECLCDLFNFLTLDP
jgi:hypothetical protein